MAVNWIDLAVLAFFCWGAAEGFIAGAGRVLGKLSAWAVAALVALLSREAFFQFMKEQYDIMPAVTTALSNRVPLAAKVRAAVPATGGGEIRGVINSINLSDPARNSMLAYYEKSGGESMLSGATAADLIYGWMAETTVNILIFFLVFFLLWALLAIVTRPGPGGLDPLKYNWGAGMAAGLLKNFLISLFVLRLLLPLQDFFLSPWFSELNNSMLLKVIRSLGENTYHLFF